MPGREYIPKLKEVEGVEGGGSSPSNMTRRLKMIRLVKIGQCVLRHLQIWQKHIRLLKYYDIILKLMQKYKVIQQT